MNKHTPTPWRVNEQLQLICAENGYRIGSVNTPHPQSRGKERREDWEYCKGNAEHIVRCVNSHDALVDALTMVRDADNDCIADGMPTMPRSARATIDAALAAAGAPQ